MQPGPIYTDDELKTPSRAKAKDVGTADVQAEESHGTMGVQPAYVEALPTRSPEPSLPP